MTLNGGADYYVSFDNVEVGRLQGQGLIQCLTEKGVQHPVIAYLNGSPTDNNATLFREGYHEVLNVKFTSGEYVKGPERSVPDWDGTQAITLFEGIMTETGGKIDGVLAANDTLGNAAISVLKRSNLNGTVPVTGQDASVGGLQNILAGDQCMTVYKAIKKEADSAAALAIALANGEQVSGLTTVKDTESGRDVPSKLEKPVAIFKDNVKDVVDDGYVTKAELCVDAFAAFAGIIQASRSNSVDGKTGGSLILYAVGAAVIGGTSLFGDRGRVMDAVVGGLVVAIIYNGMSTLSTREWIRFVVTGAVLLAAAAVDAVARRRSTTVGLR